MKRELMCSLLGAASVPPASAQRERSRERCVVCEVSAPAALVAGGTPALRLFSEARELSVYAN